MTDTTDHTREKLRVDAELERAMRTCPICEGKGYEFYPVCGESAECVECGGTGEVRAR